MPHAELPATPVRVLTIFLTFSRITLSSFGSPAFWARRELLKRAARDPLLRELCEKESP